MFFPARGARARSAAGRADGDPGRAPAPRALGGRHRASRVRVPLRSGGRMTGWLNRGDELFACMMAELAMHDASNRAYEDERFATWLVRSAATRVAEHGIAQEADLGPAGAAARFAAALAAR